MSSQKQGLFKEAQEARVLPHFILVIVLALAFLIVGQMLGEVIFQNIWEFGDTIQVRLMMYLICSFIFISILIFLWVKWIEKRKISSIGFYKKGFIKKYFIGFGIGVAMFSSVMLLLSVTRHTVIVENPSMPVGLMSISSILIVLPGWMVQSATEEILSRGWMMNVLGARYNTGLALGVSSVFFALLHIKNPNVTIIAILNIILVGLFLGIYVIKTNDLWGVCGLHCSWNWSQGNVFGLQVSGLQIETGSILQLRLVGADWFTGGAFGPEGGIAVTLILVGSIILLIKKYNEED
ncbi:MAG: CPBP family intramembrane metalloprotease [Clostridia bacterium]|nr:CPBP family intramembrane metalloprotease [Clostridia bacterium]